MHYELKVCHSTKHSLTKSQPAPILKLHSQFKRVKISMNENFAEKIYRAVRLIPSGKVATYSQIAALAGNCNLRRYVGNVLHQNPDNTITPCHRVVNAKGYCSGSFAFGGPMVQQEKLEAEGVAFTNGHVDMDRFCINGDDFEAMSLEMKVN